MGIGAPTLKSGWHPTTQLCLLLVGVACLTKHTRRRAQIDQRLLMLSILALTRAPIDPNKPDIELELHAARRTHLQSQSRENHIRLSSNSLW